MDEFYLDKNEQTNFSTLFVYDALVVGYRTSGCSVKYGIILEFFRDYECRNFPHSKNLICARVREKSREPKRNCVERKNLLRVI